MANALGRHILVELHNCQQSHLNDVAAIEKHMLEAAQAAGATVINTTFHHFAPEGVSGVVVIQESHLSIHTWPEHQFASLDIFTCGQNVDPWKAVAYLKNAFQAQGGDAREIPRGEISTTSKPPGHHIRPPQPIQHNLWFTERSENLALSLRHTGVVHQTQSKHQRIEILNTAGYGRMLVLDGQIMCTERDECVYHEMLVHVPAHLHDHPQHALVIGGGDGGAVRELCKYQSLQHIDLVEMDEAVIHVAQQHLPTLSVALKDPRVHIHIQDGLQFLSHTASQTYDLIFIDIPGADTLQNTSFYDLVRKALKSSGFMAAQIPPPVFFNDDFPNTIKTQQQIFSDIHPYFAFIPTYATGMLSFTIASKEPFDPCILIDNSSNLTHMNLRYYTPNIHRASFAMPPLIHNLLESGDTQ